MVLIPARCRRCAHTWQPSGGIQVAGAVNLQMGGNTTSCERCGGPADFIDGTMNVTDSAIELVSGPQWSADVIEHLRLSLIRIVEEQPPDPEKAVREVNAELAEMIEDAVRKGLAAQGKPANQRRRWQKTRVVLTALTALLMQNYSDPFNNVTWVVDQIQALLQYLAETGELPPTP